MEGVLQKLTTGHKTTHKEIKKTNNLLADILRVQVDILDEEKDRNKQAARDRQAAKRKKADTQPKAPVAALKRDEKKKGKGLLDAIMKGLGTLFSGGGLMKALMAALGLGAGTSLIDMIMQRLFPGRQGQSLMSRIMQRLFGRGRIGEKGIFTKMMEGLFGKEGFIAKSWNKLFGKEGSLTKMMRATFGKDGTIAKQMNKMFPKGSPVRNFTDALMKPFAKGGAFSKFFGKGGQLSKLGQGLMGKTGLGKLVRGGGLAALFAGLEELKETGSATSAAASAGGAGLGFAGGAKLGAIIGSFIAPGIGTAIGGVLGGIGGAFGGEKIAQAIYDGLMKNEFLANAFGFIDEFAKGYFGELKATFDSFLEFMGALGGAIGRISSKIGDFIGGVWDSFTNEIEYWSGFIADVFGKALEGITDFIDENVTPVVESITKFLEDTFGPTLKEIEKFLAPIVDPLKELATRIIDPLVKGLETLKGAIESVAKFIGGIFGIGGEDSAGNMGAGLASFLTGGIKNVFQGGADWLNSIGRQEGGIVEGFQNGGFVGTVPNQGGNGDRFGTMVQPGSVVLNQTASGMFQQGGMVPVMLEQGEKVFGPSDPMAGTALMMNSMFPRFQEGGEVTLKDRAGQFVKNTAQRYRDGYTAIKDGLTPNKPDPKPNETPKDDKTKLSGAKDGVIKKGPIMPGGHIDFIGDGSGFTGELKFMDGSGQYVGSYGGVSGVARTAKSSQLDRRNVSGAYMPLPDGSYPIENPMGGGSPAVGSFAAWINNTSGQIANRGQLYLHNDIGSNGTQGCIGVELGGSRGPNARTEKFVDFYNQVMPKKVNVNLGSNSGKKFVPGQLGTNEDNQQGGNLIQRAVGTGGAALSKLAEVFAPILGPLKEVFGDFASLALGPFAALLGGGQKQNQGMYGPQPQSAQNADAAGGGMGPSSGQATGAQTASQLYKQMGFTSDQWDLYRNTVAQIESGGKYDIAGGSGGHYDGRYQLGAAAKTDGARYAGIANPGHGAAARAAFRKDPALQEQLFTGFTMANYKYLMGNSKFANASKERQLQILGYAHNQGMGGAETWMTTGQVGRDGFGTKGTKYTDSIAAEFRKAKGMQTGGVANMRGAASMGTRTMVAKSQEQFAKQIASATQPVVVPVPMGGGGGTKTDNSETAGTPFPSLPAEDNSVVSMEYKYRITMGASV